MIQDTNMIQNRSFCKHENFYNFVDFQNNCVNNISTKVFLIFLKSQILFSMNKRIKTIYLGNQVGKIP